MNRRCDAWRRDLWCSNCATVATLALDGEGDGRTLMHALGFTGDTTIDEVLERLPCTGMRKEA